MRTAVDTSLLSTCDCSQIAAFLLSCNLRKRQIVSKKSLCRRLRYSRIYIYIYIACRYLFLPLYIFVMHEIVLAKEIIIPFAIFAYA